MSGIECHNEEKIDVAREPEWCLGENCGRLSGLLYVNSSGHITFVRL